MSEPSADLVRYDVTAGVATITLDFPAKRNALSQPLMRELAALIRAAQADDSVRVMVLTHTGGVFCSGMDLSEAQGAAVSDMGVRAFPAIMLSLWNSPKPVVAKIAGSARAGGIGLIAACDLAVAVRTATFAFTEVRLGLIPAVISATVLPRLEPRAATELFLTGAVFGAERAAEIGLVNTAVDAADLDSTTAAYVADLVKGGPVALGATKTLLRSAQAPRLAEDLDDLLDTSTHFFASAEGQEGIRAFAEKRPPNWVPAGSE